MTPDEIFNIFRQHERYVNGWVGGVRADPSRQNLSGLHLPNVNLQKAILRETDFGECELIGAEFSGADPTGANLHGAQLSFVLCGVVDNTGAQVGGSGRRMPTNLTGADLSEVDLSGVDLGKAVLNDTNVAGANIDRH